MPIRLQRCGTTCVTDPDHIWGNVVVIGKDYTRCEIRLTSPSLHTPGFQCGKYLAACTLMMPVRLSGHVELSIDDLIALAVVWEYLKIGRCPTWCDTHTAFLVRRGTIGHALLLLTWEGSLLSKGLQKLPVQFGLESHPRKQL